MKYILIGACITVLTSCSEFLDIKPNQKMAVPETLEHADLLLNDYSTMNMNYPALGELSADDYYLDEYVWESLPDMDERAAYIWEDTEMVNYMPWQGPYKAIYVANQVMDVLRNIPNRKTESLYQEVEGAAYFFRAFALHQLTETYTLPYAINTADTDLGVPIKLSPDLTEETIRPSLSMTYRQIIEDYQKAVIQLPVFVQAVGRPNKGAAYGGMSRVYLDMGMYEKAFLYADSCLHINGELIDFNDLDPYEEFPVPRFNREILFPASPQFAEAVGHYVAKIPVDLIAKYHDDDLRKSIYFVPHSYDEGDYLFRGSFEGSPSSAFVGLTTSEVYLIRAEAAARTGRVSESLGSLNALLTKRWRHGAYQSITETDAQKLLDIIIEERRKELLFRGRRWADLKRLNRESRYATTLKRVVGGKEYILQPNSLKYAIQIPLMVIDQSGMPQNKR